MARPREYVIREVADASIALRNGKARKRLTWMELEHKAGVYGHTMMQWNHKNAPNLSSLLPALDAVGMELVIRYKEEG